MRLMGLDWGTVRVGVAMSDEEQKLAFPLQNTLQTKNAVQEIKHLVKEYGIEKIVMGLPKTLKNESSSSTEKTKKFAETIRSKLKIDVEFVDERFSTVQSTQALRSQKIKEQDQRHIKDNIAAALMLQAYLDKK